MQDLSIPVQQIKAGAEAIVKILSKISGQWVTDFQIRKLDFAEVFCFQPMHHGRHLLAGCSPEFEEFNELQSA
jgi:hypothetical protein